MEDHQDKKGSQYYKKAYKKMQKVTEETKGQILMYHDNICEGIFHKTSAGTTRNGIEILQDTAYGYLASVKCSEDVYANGYLQGHYSSQEAFRKRMDDLNMELNEGSVLGQIQILERDSSGYVIRIQVGTLTLSGEKFRVLLELSSSNFTIQEVNGEIRFLCQGNGHGLGMSQFGANERAKKGDNYLSILYYYFPDTTVKKINLQV